jgi:hypothetical protein
MFGNLDTDSEGIYYSYDLTTATDRFPLETQYRVLVKLIGKPKADAWKTIMVKEPFHFKGTWIKYNTGQPMGAYSSWPSFTITHHLILLLAAKQCGYNPSEFNQYMILGDDIVISNTPVAKRY